MVRKLLNHDHPYILQKLSPDDALSLFAQNSLGENNFDLFPELRQHGEGIIKKCDGLPLALEALGRLLRNRTDEEEWKRLLDNEIWMLEDEGGILLALRLSYHDLSACLKQLFAYCCLIPKDYVFKKKDLILWWMVEGFLHNSNTNKIMEFLGEGYFQELLSRSFFQHAPDDESLFVMHDLMNDLDTFVAGEFFSRLDIDTENNVRKEAFKKYRHMSFVCEKYMTYNKFKAFERANSLRTFLAMRDEVNLSQKRVGKLHMGWSNVFDDSRNEKLKKEVLGALKPYSDNLKDLVIESYGGPEFLRRGIAFPKLESLIIRNIRGWEVWSTKSGVVGEVMFPCLKELYIVNCPNLAEVSLEALPSLRVLGVSVCGDGVLTSLIHVASSVTELSIQSIYLWESEAEASKVLVNLKKFIEVLTIVWCDSIASISFPTREGHKLKSLKIDNYEQLLEKEVLLNTSMPLMLESVYIYRWKNLESINELACFINITELRIENSFLRSSAKLNLSSSSNLLPSCALVKKNMISEFAEALTPL
ncbi:NB-ARC domains-containing protein [Tanacetum coccineum]